MKTDLESLLKPISGDAPAGRLLRGTIAYRKIEAALQEDLSGAAAGGVLIRAKPEECAALAIEALSAETKDLHIAVWLAEALTRLDGFDGLCRALDLIRELIARFWDTVYPLAEDGDEEVRAAPLVRLTGRSFSRTMEQIPVTRDGYTRLDEKILKAIPLRDEIGSDENLAALRRDAEEKKRVLPESFAASLRATGFGFYERMFRDIAAAREAVRRLEEECGRRFTDPYALPQFGSLLALFEPYEELATEMMRQKMPPPEPVPEPVAIEPEPEAVPIAAMAEEPPPVASPPEAPTPPPSQEAPAASREPLSEEDAAQRVFAAARYLRRQNPANPAAFLLTRSWHFGAALARSGIDDADLEPPPPEVRKELWRLHRDQDWNSLLESVETAMELRCSAAWLDLQYYAGAALENLGESYDAARRTVCDLVRQYVTMLPDAPRKQLLDGTPAASPSTARWLESLASAAEAPWDARPAQPDPDTGPKPSDSSEAITGIRTSRPGGSENCPTDAMRLAESGRIAEALKAFYEGQQPEDTGRGRFESRLRVASLCIAAEQHALALPGLRELRREIDQWSLAEWDPEPASRALAMLYECLGKTGAKTEEIAEVFDKICVMDPLLAVRLGDRR